MRFLGYAVLLMTFFVVSALAGEQGWSGGTSEQTDRQKIHQAFSAGCFNKCWSLIDKADRSPEDVENMILLANASLWHWKQRSDRKPRNLSIGYWQVSRVYALAGEVRLARRYGEKCLKVSVDNRLSPFYLGYAYEALARAEAVAGNTARASGHLSKARAQLAEVEDEEEKTLLAADLDALKKEVWQRPTSLK